jgi:hypothetical protein
LVIEMRNERPMAQLNQRVQQANTIGPTRDAGDKLGARANATFSAKQLLDQMKDGQRSTARHGGQPW